jgi:hypothetical protein
MQDNLAGEVLITLQDVDWMTPTPEGFAAAGVKLLVHNWSRDLTCAGILPAFSSVSLTKDMCFAVSPNFRWIFLNRAWIYVPHPHEYLVAPTHGPVPVPFAPGERVPFDPEWDMIRYNYKNPWDTSSTNEYNYRVRRVAYLDGDGRLVKTAAWAELQAQVEAKIVSAPTPEATTIQSMQLLSDMQILKDAPDEQKSNAKLRVAAA